MDQGALVQRVLDAVAPLSVRALLTAGPAIDPETLRMPANARAVSFVPHRAVFPHASLVVTHAGWQTVNAALADGVPLVCIPDGRDQPDNAARVVEAGAGLRVKKSAPPDKLRDMQQPCPQPNHDVQRRTCGQIILILRALRSLR